MAMIHRNLLLILAVHFLSSSLTVNSSPSLLSPFAACADGSIEQCLAYSSADSSSGSDEFEFDFDSEISRRILATSKYISYGALDKNSVPCSRRGASYYNCRPGASGNPYTRGCSAITRCRGG